MAAFTMPALGADMETGTVVEWLVKPGDPVKAGDVVAVVETHKGAIDVECFLDGVIGEMVAPGVALPVGAVLAQVRETGEAAPAVVAPAAAAGPVAPALRTVPAAPAAPDVAEASMRTSVAARTPSPASLPAGTRERVSPAARRRAQQLGVDADALGGSGADGAVVLTDVERAVARPTPPSAPPAPAQRQPRGSFDPARMRQAIAAAMVRSKREIPHYYLASTIDFDTAQTWLDAYNAAREPVDRLLPATLLLKATARALLEVPQLNGFYEGDAFRAGPGVHIGWAIALRGGGLVAPALHDVDRQTLPQLMAALRDLVQRARSGGLRSSELTDPTITVTSLGERGAESVLGVVYPPQVAIVGFGRVLVRPWVVDGQVAARRLVASTLAADHRVSDGHVGGQLLAAIERALQAPQDL